MPDDVLIAQTVRGGFIDCYHYGSVVVVDAGGKVLFSAGDIHKRVFERSATKPIKAVAVVDSGAVDKLPWGDAEIALMGSSHSGTMMHTERVLKMLGDLGLDESALQCGVQIPLGEEAVKELVSTDGSVLRQLHNDCSGEHTGGLALCLHRGFPLEGYHQIGHPVRKEIRGVVEEFLDYSTTDHAIDGCSLPTYYTPLVKLATGMANFTGGKMYAESAGRVIQAMVNQPQFVAGEQGRLTTQLIRSSGGKIIGKGGAEGLYVAGWPGRGIGLALKVADGNLRSAGPVMADIIEGLDLMGEEDMKAIREQTSVNLYNNRGTLVGEVQSLIDQG